MIKTFTKLSEFTKYRTTLRNESVGLVATMGNLHAGHLSLLEKSLSENTHSIFTIFVNPKQFAVNEDLDIYPRTLEEDLNLIAKMAQKYKKSVAVFAPESDNEIYPAGFSTTISVGAITQKLEGKIRPTHFDGVTTVVYRLFQITKPTTAYFGQKDFQQCAVIKKMIVDLSLQIRMLVMPIVRDQNGLALSSRNQYLNETEKREALTLSMTLNRISQLLLEKKDYTNYKNEILKDKSWDYLEVLDSTTLEDLTPESAEAVILGVYRRSSTRLLDNLLVTLKKN